MSMSFTQLLLHNAAPQTHLSPSLAAYIALTLCIYFGGLYAPCPGSGAGWGGILRWALPVLLRNFVLTWGVYSAWYYALYEREPRLSSQKMNTKIAHPPAAQLRLEKRHALGGVAIASLAEMACAALHARGGGASGGASGGGGGGGASTALHVCWFVYIAVVFSDYHFFCAHRVLHPWFASAAPGARLDPGRALYRVVHSVHHKAVNPNPWSGISMHWFEHVLYFSRAPVFLWLVGGCHPLVFLFVNTRALLGPAPGHHGFEDCLGSRFHYLHHVYHDCNFGTRPSDGMDWLGGTLREESADSRKQARKD